MFVLVTLQPTTQFTGTHTMSWTLFSLIIEASPPESGDTLTDDDTIAPPPQPVAPPISSMDQIPGYGGIGFEGEGSAGNIPLPPTTQPSAPQPPNDTPTPE